MENCSNHRLDDRIYHTGRRLAVLAFYRKPSSDSYDGVDSEIRVIWHTDDGDETKKLSGSHAEALEVLALGIAEEAYTASNLEADSHAGASGLPRRLPGRRMEMPGVRDAEWQ